MPALPCSAIEDSFNASASSLESETSAQAANESQNLETISEEFEAAGGSTPRPAALDLLSTPPSGSELPQPTGAHATSNEVASSLSPLSSAPTTQAEASPPDTRTYASMAREVGSPGHIRTLREQLEVAHVEELNRVRKEMEDKMVQREEQLRRDMMKANAGDARSPNAGDARSPNAGDARSPTNGVIADRARKVAEDGANRSMQTAVARADRERREAIRIAVMDASRKLDQKHAIELASLRSEHQKNVVSVKDRLTKQIAAARAKGIAEEAARWEAQRMDKTSQAKVELEQALRVAETAESQIAKANEARVEVETRAKQQVARATELLAANESRVEAAVALAESQEAIVARLEEEKSVLVALAREQAEAEVDIMRMQCAIDVAVEKAKSSKAIEEARAITRAAEVQVERAKYEIAQAFVTAAEADAERAELVASVEAAQKQSVVAVMREEFELKIDAAAKNAELKMADAAAKLEAEKHIVEARLEEAEARVRAAHADAAVEQIELRAMLQASATAKVAACAETDAKLARVRAETEQVRKELETGHGNFVAKLELEKRVAAMHLEDAEGRVMAAQSEAAAAIAERDALLEAHTAKIGSLVRMQAEARVLTVKVESEAARQAAETIRVEAAAKLAAEKLAMVEHDRLAEANVAVGKKLLAAMEAEAAAALDAAVSEVAAQVAEAEAAILDARSQRAAAANDLEVAKADALAKLETDKQAALARLDEQLASNQMAREGADDLQARAATRVAEERARITIRGPTEEALVAANAKASTAREEAQAAKLRATHAEADAATAKAEGAAVLESELKKLEAARNEAEAKAASSRAGIQRVQAAAEAAEATAAAKKEADNHRARAEAERRRSEASRMANAEAAILRRPGGQQVLEALGGNHRNRRAQQENST